MDTLNPQVTAGLGIAILIAALLSILTLVLLYSGLPAFGPLNDLINAISGLLIAAFVWQFHATILARSPLLAVLLLIIAWVGVAAIAVNSLLVAAGCMHWTTGGMYTAIGYALVGIWLLALLCASGAQSFVPTGLIRLGALSGVALLFGLAAGPLLASAVGFTSSPFVALAYLGSGTGWLLFPLWCWLLGRRLVAV